MNDPAWNQSLVKVLLPEVRHEDADVAGGRGTCV